MSLPMSASQTAMTANSKEINEGKLRDCIDTVHALVGLFAKGIHARDIMTRKAFENAITVCYAVGGR